MVNMMQFKELDEFYKDLITGHFRDLKSRVNEIRVPLLSDDALMKAYKVANDVIDNTTEVLTSANHTWEIDDRMCNVTTFSNHHFYFRIELKPKIIRKANLFQTSKVEKYPRVPEEIFTLLTPDGVKIHKHDRNTFDVIVDVEGYEKSEAYQKLVEVRNQITDDHELIGDAYCTWKEHWLQKDYEHLGYYIPSEISDEDDIVDIFNEHTNTIQEMLDDIGRLSNPQCDQHTSDSS